MFKTRFPTITAEKSKLSFQRMTQGNETVSRFYANLRRIVKLAYPDLPDINREELIRQQFLQGLSYDNQMEARRIGLESPIPVLLRKLEEIERFKTIDTSQQPIQTAQSTLTAADIERIVNSRMQATQQPQTQTYQQPQPRYIIPGAENAYVDDTKGGNYNFEDMKNLANELVAYMKKSAPMHPLEVDESRNKLLDIAETLGYPDNYPKDANSLRNWIDIELSRRLPKDDIYNFNLKKVLEVLKDQPIKTSKTSRKVSRKCSKCGKSGHTKSSCPKAKKKRKKKTNYVEEVSSSENSSSSESESEYESSDSSSSDENRVCYGLKKKVLL